MRISLFAGCLVWVCRLFGHRFYHKWGDDDWSCRVCGKFQEGNCN